MVEEPIEPTYSRVDLPREPEKSTELSEKFKKPFDKIKPILI
jgi:hypothetical protein